MPVQGGYQCGFWEADPRRWERCRAKAALQMVADGWNKHSKKFSTVQTKRAIKLWNSK